MSCVFKLDVMSEFQFTESPPEFVPELPRSSELGTVSREVGVIEETSEGDRYWKAYQLIERDGEDGLIRSACSTEDGGYVYQPLVLPSDVMADLHEFASGKVL